MLWCKECNQEIDEKDLIMHKYEQVHVCPECGMADFSEAHICAICDSWFDGDNLKLICKDCRRKVDEDLLVMFNRIKKDSGYNLPWGEVVDIVAEEVDELGSYQ